MIYFCPYCNTDVTENTEKCPNCKHNIKDFINERKMLVFKDELLHNDATIQKMNNNYANWGMLMYGGLIPAVVSGFFLCTQIANDADFSFFIGVSLIVFLISFPVYIIGLIVRGIKGRKIRKILDKKYEQYRNENSL